MQCFVCKKILNPLDHRHANRCAGTIGVGVKEARFRQICFNMRIDFTKELLQDQYVYRGKSLPDLRKEYGLAYKQSLFLLSYFGIPARTATLAMKSARRLQKYESTCMRKYGTDNASKVESIKQAKRDAFLARYGVDNVWKTPSYRAMAEKTMLNRYGVKSLSNRFGGITKAWSLVGKEERKRRTEKMREGYRNFWNSLTDEEKSALIRKRTSRLIKSFKSRLESRIQKILTRLGLSFTWQKWVDKRSYDFHILGTTLLIEVQGDYWHANPSKYKADDKLNFGTGIVRADSVWAKDENKLRAAEKYGYSVMYLWEKDMSELDDKELANKILLRLGLQSVLAENMSMPAASP